MGGVGSGRKNGTLTAERLHSLTLDVNEVMRGYTRRSGVYRQWEWPGRCTLWVSVGASLNGRPDAVLRFRLPGSHPRAPSEFQQIPLVPVYLHLGGARWCFTCPRTGKPCTRLILPHGRVEWASRRGYGLGYESQRETVFARACRRAARLTRKLTEGKVDRSGRKVRMQRRTLERLSREAAGAMALVEGMAYARFYPMRMR